MFVAKFPAVSMPQSRHLCAIAMARRAMQSVYGESALEIGHDHGDENKKGEGKNHKQEGARHAPKPDDEQRVKRIVAGNRLGPQHGSYGIAAPDRAPASDQHHRDNDKQYGRAEQGDGVIVEQPVKSLHRAMLGERPATLNTRVATAIYSRQYGYMLA